jgi:ubiquinone/menaquinone biosynthesis C-methylase UbiE
MHKENNAREIRSEILAKYYAEIYQSYLFQQDTQGIGIRYFEKSLEKFWNKKIPEKVLEIGGGSGEHLPYLRYIPRKSYTSLDIRDKFSDSHTLKLSEDLIRKIDFVKGDAQNLPFPDASFDRVFSTCLLHHVDDVLAVLLEARRVTAQGGGDSFYHPNRSRCFESIS